MEQYGEAAQEELTASPLRAAPSNFPRALAEQAVSDDTPVVTYEPTSNFTYRPAADRETDCGAWIEEHLEPVLAVAPERAEEEQIASCLGMDFARSGDLSIIALFLEDRRLQVDAAVYIEMRNVPFSSSSRSSAPRSTARRASTAPRSTPGATARATVGAASALFGLCRVLSMLATAARGITYPSAGDQPRRRFRAGGIDVVGAVSAPGVPPQTPVVADEGSYYAYLHDKPESIGVGEDIWWPTLMVVHEIGHFVDHAVCPAYAISPSSARRRCLVRVVHSLFASTDDWDAQLEGSESGWPYFFGILRLYLTHFRGRPAAVIRAMGTTPGAVSDAWGKLTGALGVPGSATSERWSARPAGIQPLAGVVERVTEGRQPHALLRLDDPLPGIAAPSAFAAGDQVMITLGIYLYGDGAAEAAARDEPLWQAWLNELFE